MGFLDNFRENFGELRAAVKDQLQPDWELHRDAATAWEKQSSERQKQIVVDNGIIGQPLRTPEGNICFSFTRMVDAERKLFEVCGYVIENQPVTGRRIHCQTLLDDALSVSDAVVLLAAVETGFRKDTQGATELSSQAFAELFLEAGREHAARSRGDFALPNEPGHVRASDGRLIEHCGFLPAVNGASISRRSLQKPVSSWLPSNRLLLQ